MRIRLVNMSKEKHRIEITSSNKSVFEASESNVEVAESRKRVSACMDTWKGPMIPQRDGGQALSFKAASQIDTVKIFINGREFLANSSDILEAINDDERIKYTVRAFKDPETDIISLVNLTSYFITVAFESNLSLNLADINTSTNRTIRQTTNAIGARLTPRAELRLDTETNMYIGLEYHITVNADGHATDMEVIAPVLDITLPDGLTILDKTVSYAEVVWTVRVDEVTGAGAIEITQVPYGTILVKDVQLAAAPTFTLPKLYGVTGKWMNAYDTLTIGTSSLPMTNGGNTQSVTLEVTDVDSDDLEINPIYTIDNGTVTARGAGQITIVGKSTSYTFPGEITSLPLVLNMYRLTLDTYLSPMDKGKSYTVSLNINGKDTLPEGWSLSLEDASDGFVTTDYATYSINPDKSAAIDFSIIKHGLNGGTMCKLIGVYTDAEGVIVARQNINFLIEQEGTVIVNYDNATTSSVMGISVTDIEGTSNPGGHWIAFNPYFPSGQVYVDIGQSKTIYLNSDGWATKGQIRIRPIANELGLCEGKVGIISDKVTEIVSFGKTGLACTSDALAKVPDTLPPTLLSVSLRSSTLNDPAISNWKIEETRLTSLNSVLAGCRSFNQPVPWNTSNITDFSHALSENSAFNQAIGWDTSKATIMSYMLYNAKSFNQLLNLQTHNVTDMEGFLSGASSFNRPLTLDLSNVTNMYSMLAGASSFNQDITTLDVRNAENMDSMLIGTAIGTERTMDLSGWCVPKITTAPNNFLYVYPAALLPVWGTCPNG